MLGTVGRSFVDIRESIDRDEFAALFEGTKSLPLLEAATRIWQRMDWAAMEMMAETFLKAVAAVAPAIENAKADAAALEAAEEEEADKAAMAQAEAKKKKEEEAEAIAAAARAKEEAQVRAAKDTAATEQRAKKEMAATVAEAEAQAVQTIKTAKVRAAEIAAALVAQAEARAAAIVSAAEAPAATKVAAATAAADEAAMKAAAAVQAAKDATAAKEAALGKEVTVTVLLENMYVTHRMLFRDCQIARQLVCVVEQSGKQARFRAQEDAVIDWWESWCESIEKIHHVVFFCLVTNPCPLPSCRSYACSVRRWFIKCGRQC